MPIVLIAIVTLACFAVPATAAWGLINYLKPWRLVQASWLLAAGILGALVLAVRFSESSLFLVALWTAALVSGIAIGWYFYRLRVQPVLPALDLDRPALLPVKQAHDRGEPRQARNELLAYFRSRPNIDGRTFARQPDAEIIRLSDGQLRNVFAFPELPPVQMPSSFRWSANPLKQQAWRFCLHEMGYVVPLVERYRSTGDSRYLQRAEDLIFDWIKNNHHYLIYPPDQEYSWQDHDTARRARAWLDFWGVWIESPLASDVKAETLLESIFFHATKLADPIFYAPTHNHGIDQDFALIAIATIFPEFRKSQAWLTIAKNRLREQIIQTISPNGVSREHSPKYHLYVMALLSDLHEFCKRHQLTLTTEIGIDRLLPKMARFASYLVQPDGTLPTLGDTTPGEKVDEHHPVLARFAEQDPVLRYAVTHGRSGLPEGKLVVYESEGYAIFRDAYPPSSEFKNNVYLLFTAATDPHLAHKHWDDLSFILAAGGRQLLIDSGIYAYHYKEAGRKYVISTAAHNTIVVDGASFSGSASRIEDTVAAEEFWIVRAINDNYPGLRHRRTLLYARPATIFVIDEIVNREQGPNVPVQHKFEQLFHLAPELEPRVDPARAVVMVHEMDSDELVVRIEQFAAGKGDVEVIVGQTDPMQGWVTAELYKLVPAPVVRTTASGEATIFVTRISMESPAHKSAGRQQFNSRNWSQIGENEITLVWEDDRGRRRAAISRIGPLTATFSIEEDVAQARDSSLN